jgi:CubicO group peptidase (beta-lactamase class C family)
MTTRSGRSLALFILIGATAARAQEPAPPTAPKTFDVAAIDTYVAGFVKTRDLTGLGLAIVKDGKIVLAKGYGKKSRATGAGVLPETPFAIGSVTKQIVCASILLLAEEGKLSTADKVLKYYPELTKAGDISLYHLMTHTSGYPDFYPLDFVDRRMSSAKPVDDVIREYCTTKLDFEPGSRWSYSNTGFLILGRVVEKVSGQSLDRFLKERILDPAGMEHSVFEPTGEDPSRPTGYLSFMTGPPEPAKPEARGWAHAAGGLWCSAPDLSRWSLALMAGRVLKPTSFALMTEPVTLSDGRRHDYGCGLGIKRDGGETILSHGGAVSGFRAYLGMIPRTRSSVAILGNDESVETTLGQTILGLLLRTDTGADVPHVSGPPATEAALDFFHQMQAGKLDRDRLGEEFSIYLTEDRIQGAAKRLKTLGEPASVEVVGRAYERGGMEVSPIEMTFPDRSTVLHGLLYRSPDGKIQQLLFEKR